MVGRPEPFSRDLYLRLRGPEEHALALPVHPCPFQVTFCPAHTLLPRRPRSVGRGPSLGSSRPLHAPGSLQHDFSGGQKEIGDPGPQDRPDPSWEDRHRGLWDVGGVGVGFWRKVREPCLCTEPLSLAPCSVLMLQK